MPKLPTMLMMKNSAEVMSAMTSIRYRFGKLTASLGLHGQVAAPSIAFQWPVDGKLGENLPNFAWRAENAAGGVDGEGKDEYDDDDDKRVDVVRDEGGLDASEQRVGNDTWVRVRGINACNTTQAYQAETGRLQRPPERPSGCG